MDQVSRIRLKNLLDRLLSYCDEAAEDERAILLRISIVALNKLRIHVNVDAELGFEVRALNKQIGKCKDKEQLVGLWADATDLVQAYREALA